MIQDFTANLVDKKQLAHDVWQFGFNMPEGVELQFAPGQYLLLDVDGNFRQYSISSPNMRNNYFELIVEILPNGLASQFFSNLQVGGTAKFKGPAGVFVLRGPEKEKVFLATGTGIAPIKSMIESAVLQKSAAKMHLFFGMRTQEDVYLFAELEKLSNENQNFTFHICLSREEDANVFEHSCYHQGRIDKGLEAFIKEGNLDPKVFEYYICGSKKVVDSVQDYVKQLGVPPENIFFERFTL